ncbi:DHH family phosphoesterase [Kosmotoga pacifica]|uniref:Phosphoesterase n=1 Tax=Kosmotoga pacifica TaxID=1330330 RepID=A0A0G2Z676_9BACT|nr:bifunctional oligoribonuclease/PAP phosphatase NrnA [Kosmotoga pacifica]AKI97110.1 phosphoesterase [Kosmotoga pacifica]
MRSVNALISEINQAEKILVCGHIMPDGDCISSVLSLYMGLRSLRKRVIPAVDWKISMEYYNFPHTGEIVRYSRNFELPDLMIVVDSSSPDRIGGFQELLKAGVRTAVIDHHKTNTYFGNVNWVSPGYSSTAQMVFRLLQIMDVSFDQELALLNYIGIATDTGFFRYTNVDSSVFEDAACLVKYGADPAFVARVILENRKLEEFYLERDALENLEVRCSGKFAYSYLEKENFEKYGLSEEEFSGFVSELRSIASVEVAMFASESKKGEAHVSLRSKRYFDVSEVAKAFGGGGHERAAGFTLTYDGVLPEALEEVTRFIIERLEEK